MRKESKIKQHIVAVAANLFHTQGYNNTGINEVIAKAEIAKSTLYAHFSSKENLCIAYLKYMDKNFLDGLFLLLERQSTILQKVSAIFQHLKNFMVQEHFRGCWCLNTLSEIPIDNVKIKNEILQQKAFFLKTIEGLFLEELSTINKEQVQRLSKQIYLLFEGAAVECQLQGAAWPIEEAEHLAGCLVEQLIEI